MLGEEQARRVKLFCQIVDDSGKLLTRRSLSIRRSSSMPWQGSQNLDADPAKPSAAATGIPCLMAANAWGRTKYGRWPSGAFHACWALAEHSDQATVEWHATAQE